MPASFDWFDYFDYAQYKSAHHKFAQDKHGFTLIELLVVISIIAILATIGMTVYTGTQRSARDAKRRGDINTIAVALEVHFGDTSGSGCTATPSTYCIPTTNPSVLPNSWFSNGSVPSDPLASSAGAGIGPGGTCGLASGGDGIYNDHCWYCVKAGGLNPTAGYCSVNDGYMTNFNTLWAPDASSVWMICAN